MKTYNTTCNGEYFIGDLGFPASTENRHYKQMMAEVEAGDAEILPYVQPDITIDIVRAERNKLLSESDKWLLSDYPRGCATEQEIRDYRQALRDLTNNVNLSGKKTINQVKPLFPSRPL